MTFDESCQVEISFGKKHKGRTLWNVVQDDPKYIDWLLDQSWVGEPVKSALDVFCKDRSVQRRIDEAVY